MKSKTKMSPSSWKSWKARMTIKRLTQENNKLKIEKEHLTKGLAKFTRGKDLQSELFMNTVMKMEKSGIGYKAQQSKLIKSQATHDQRQRLIESLTMPQT